MHRIVGQNISKYLIRDERLVQFFEKLKGTGKETFIITNSPFYFVWVAVFFFNDVFTIANSFYRDIGMTYLLGENWHSYFDVVIAKAKKPDFFVDKMRPFREFIKEVHMTDWGPVTALEKGKVYLEVRFFFITSQ